MAYLSWIRICISPYGSDSGSGFHFTNPDPDPHHWAVDPLSFFADSDPAVFLNADPDPAAF